MKPTKDFDKLLQELGDLYEFNREIGRFSFVSSNETVEPGRGSEEITKYEVRNTHP